MCGIHRSLNLGIAFSLLLGLCSPVRAGQVSTDGSVGSPATTLHGPSFSIGAKLGRQRGGNLFHSFSSFNLDPGESATFTGPRSGPHVTAVFTRITGGLPSNIDGTIACTIPNADFYLINPAGVIFGPDAALDVKGSFTVTTADYLKHADGTRFDARSPMPVLSTAAPAAFGFLAAAPAGVSVQGSASQTPSLAVPQGKGLSLVAGPLSIRHGQLLAPAGSVNLLAVGSPGQAELGAPAAGVNTAADVSSFARLADVRLADGSSIDLSGPTGGRMFARANDLTLEGRSSISSFTSAQSPAASGLNSDLAARGSVRIAGGSSITVGTIGPGRGGDLILAAAAGLLVDGRGSPSPELSTTVATVSQPATSGGPPANGAVGNLTLRAGRLQVLAGATIATSTSGEGRGGDVSVTASDVTVDARGDPFSNTTTIIVAASQPGASGAGGNLTVNARRVQLLAGGVVATAALNHGPGPPGDLNVTATDITIDGTENPAPSNGTGIATQSQSAKLSGSVRVRAGRLLVLGGGTISATTFGTGGGGDLLVTANDLTIDARGDLKGDSFSTSISTDSFSAASGGGAGGSLTVRAARIRLLAGGEIKADTFGPGHGGDLILTAGDLTIDARGVPSLKAPTGVSTDQDSDTGTGPAGNLIVSGGRLRLLAGGQISATTFGQAPGGDVIITGSELIIDDGGNPYHQTTGSAAGIFATADGNATGAAGNIRVRVAGNVSLKHGGILFATRTRSSGGDLRLEAGHSILLDGGRISTRAQQTGGSVRLVAPLLIRLTNRSTINTESTAGNGGNLSIDPLELTLDHTSRISANGQLNGGNISIAADAVPGAVFRGAAANITATGSTGVSGSVSSAPANTDIAHSLARLPSDLQGAALTLQPQCGQVLTVSTFLIQGRGAVESSPGFWQTDLDFAPTAEGDERR